MPDHDPALDTPMTFGDLLDAIHGCGEAFGEALHTAMVEVGAGRQQRISVAKVLQSTAVADQPEGPKSHARTAIVTGFLAGLQK